MTKVRTICPQCHRTFDLEEGQNILPLHHYQNDGVEDTEQVVCDGSLDAGITLAAVPTVVFNGLEVPACAN